MNINIYGSTGIIGKKTLKLIEKYFPNIKVNLLCAKSNVHTLREQIKKFKPKYVYLHDSKNALDLKLKIDSRIKILNYTELNDYLLSSKSDLSILAISGYKSLYFLDQIVKNTDHLGIVSKECIVSAGHIFKKKKYFNKTKIFPLDSEHFSLFNYFKKNNYKTNLNNIDKIILTASGGPFYKKKFKNLKNIKFEQAIKHPKWDMGFKNSIDSATLVNKCLELVEAHYLFQIPFKKLDILIHPDAITHSILHYTDYTINMNLFKNDMNIPIVNFLMQSRKNFLFTNKNFDNINYSNLKFENVKNNIFPIYTLFKKIDKSKPENLIKFNIGNEMAVNLFKNRMINYTDIYNIIKKVTSLNLYSSLNNIKDIINYHEKIEKKLQEIYKVNF